jgi:hypothetical protein
MILAGMYKIAAHLRSEATSNLVLLLPPYDQDSRNPGPTFHQAYHVLYCRVVVLLERVRRYSVQ